MPAPRRPGKPDLIEELAVHARTRKVIQGVGVGKYYNSAELLLRQAYDYRLRNNDALLYVFLLRYASLVLETIPKHPDFRMGDPKYKRLYQRLEKEILPELEHTKARIKLSGLEPSERRRYPQAPRPVEAVQTSLTTLPGLDWARFTQPSGTNGFATASSVPSAPSVDLLSGSGGGSGVPSAHQQQQLNLLPFDPRALGAASSFPAASDEARQRHALLPSVQERRRPLAVSPAQRPLYPEFDASPVAPIDFGLHSAGASAPPLLGPPVNGRQQQQPSLMDSEPAVALQPPPQPPAQLTTDLQQQVAGNVKPQLELQLGPQEMQVDMVSPTGGAPCCTPQHPPSPLEKDFEGIRDVNVSVSLMEDFMRLCVSNTQRNIETIGLLGGSLSADGSSFNINTLIIPKQKGETDRVEMLKEEEIWDIFFQDGVEAQQSLFPVGWIHTHPAFDCFLSSVDIHNQYGYQVMLEEAVAIVMSPRDSKNRRCGIFRLTTPGGMDLIKDCRQTGFHTHPPTSTGQKIYELCGHVYINPRVSHQVVDLRS